MPIKAILIPMQNVIVAIQLTSVQVTSVHLTLVIKILFMNIDIVLLIGFIILTGLTTD